MTMASEAAGGSRASSLALRYALREMRSGLRGFYVFIACIALGVMAIAGVGSVAASLSDGLSREGRTLLGGDVAFSLIQREATPEELAFLRARGEVSVAAALRVMARSGDGRLALVELKAVDGKYPMLGELTLDPKMPVADLLAERDGVFGAAVDSTLLARLDLKLGDRISIGNANYQIRSVVGAEPDKLAGNVGLGPRFLVSETSLRATGLLQPGSLVRWIYRLKLPDNAADERAATQLIDSVRAALPEAGWWIRSRANASPQLERTISRFTQFLTLVGLAALLVGGVGVANAVKSHIDRRRDVIASFKALGATGRDVFTIYLTQVVVLAGIGSIIGLAAGAALPFVIVGLFGKLLPLPVIPALHLDELALSFIYGLLTALAFGLWPLGRVHDVPVAALFREEVAREWHRPRWSYLVLMAVVIALLIAVAIGLAYDKRVAAVFVASSVAVFALLRGVAAGLMALARRLPRSRHHHAAAGDCQHLPARRADALGRDVAGPWSRRPRHHHPDRRQSAPAVPGGAAGPRALVLLHRHPDLGSRPLRRVSQADRAAIDRGGCADAARTHRRGPRRQGRRAQADAGYRMGAAERPRPDLYRPTSPRARKSSRAIGGRRTISGPPLVSMEKKIADGMKLKIGDEIVVNVLGRDIPAKIANLRNVDWQGLGINFVLVFSPNAFKGAPHTHVATLSEAHPDPAGDARIIKQVADAFPMVTSVRVREALDTDRHRRHQPHARDPRRQRGDADLGHPGAGRRARRRPSPPGL